MREWLTIEVALGLLLVTSFTCVGFVALWAATSPRHWFLRTAAVVAFLSPLLFVPAYEPFVAFLLQAAVVAAGVTIARSCPIQRGKDPAKTWTQATRTSGSLKLHFSLTTMLLLTVPVASGVLLATRLPRLNLAAWQSIVLDGIVAGLAALIGGWIVVSKQKLMAWPSGIALAVLIASLPAWFDWFSLSFSTWGWSGWPPTNSLGGVVPLQVERPIKLWFAVVPLVACILTVLTIFWRSRFISAPTSAVATSSVRQRAKHRLDKAIFVVLIAIVGTYPLAILGKLLMPQSIPHVTRPNPNGYDDLVAAGGMIQSPLLDFSVEPKSTDELAAEISKFKAAFDRIRLGLSRSCQAPVWPKNGDLTTRNSTPNAIINVRADARALNREAQLALRQNRFDDSALIALDCIHLGQACTRGGLLVDRLMGTACESIGDAALYPSIKQLDSRTCRKLVVALQNVDENREPLEDVRRRERIWDENAYGWHGLLTNLLADVSGTYGDNYRLVANTYLPRKQAITRLLILELAVRCCQIEQSALPENLDQLLPDILTRIPLDPFDPKGRPMRYLRTTDGYVLYSFGINGVDDGGSPPAKDELNPALSETGDLRLDVYFPQLDDYQNQMNSGDSAESGTTDPNQKERAKPDE